MKTEKKLLLAFILNLAFSVFEFIGGIITGSVAITSDAVHDIGDAASIGISYFLEKKSRKAPDEAYTYGYLRFSVLGGVITTCILLFGSLAVIYNAVLKIISPAEINYDGMIIFAVIGLIVNSAAAYFTSGGNSLNRRAVNLHMLEDVFGWAVVLVGALVMKFTDISVLDPIMSIAVAVFIITAAVRNLKDALDLFLEKIPRGISIEEISRHVSEIEGVVGVHHIHLWSMDGHNNYATMHIVSDGDSHEIKERVREELREHGIKHTTLELESTDEHCHDEKCRVDFSESVTHAHHHHH